MLQSLVIFMCGYNCSGPVHITHSQVIGNLKLLISAALNSFISVKTAITRHFSKLQ